MGFNDLTLIRILLVLFFIKALALGVTLPEVIAGAVAVVAAIVVYRLSVKQFDHAKEIADLQSRMDEAEHNITAVQFRGKQ